MSHYINDVRLFHDKFNTAAPVEFTNLTQELLNFRVKFLEEEYQEYVDSCQDGDLVTAIDSLIDLVYITCGTAIYHGIQSEEWSNITSDEDGLYNTDESTFFTVDEPLHLKPAFLTPVVNVEFTHHLCELILQYSVEASLCMEEARLMKANDIRFQSAELTRPIEIKRLLGSIYTSALAGASYMGVSHDCWDELWADVQGCNMAKEKVKSAAQSKRGSAFDVIKPPGWHPPSGEIILAKYT